MMTLFIVIVVVAVLYALIAVGYFAATMSISKEEDVPLRLPMGRSSNVPPPTIRSHRGDPLCWYLSPDEAAELARSPDMGCVSINPRYGNPEFWQGRRVVVVDPALHHLTLGRVQPSNEQASVI